MQQNWRNWFQKADKSHDTWEMASFTVMRKWKLLFMSGRMCRSCVFAVRKFLNSCQDVTNTSIRSGIILKNDTHVEYISYI